MCSIKESLKQMGYTSKSQTPQDDPAAVEGQVPSPTVIYQAERDPTDIYPGHNTVEYNPFTGIYTVEGIEISTSIDEGGGSVFTGYGDGTSCPV